MPAAKTMGCFAMRSRKNILRLFWTPTFVLFIAAFVRLFFILQLPERVLWSDEQKNLSIAANLVDGKGYTLNDRPTAIIPLAYPLFLAALHHLGLTTLLQLRLFQLVISLLTIYLAGKMAKQYFGERTRVPTMIVFALYPYFVYLPGTILATTLFCFLVLLGSYLYVNAISYNKKIYLIISGVVWGVAALAVSTAVVLVAALIMWQVCNNKYRHRYRDLALFLAVFCITVGPWLVRNYQQLGIFNLASNGGYNFWLGNNPDADINHPCSLPTPDELQQRLIAAGDEAKQDAIFIQEAWQYIKAEPISFVWRTLLKALYFWRLDFSQVTSSYVEINSAVRVLGWISFAPLLLLAIVGYKNASPETKRIIYLWLWMAIGFTMIHAVMIVKVRLRLPLDQFVILLAMAGADVLWRKFNRQKSDGR